MGNNSRVLAEAIVGWVIEVIGDKSIGALSQGILGPPDRRALVRSVTAAVDAVIEDLPAQAHEPVAFALRERFAVPAISVDARTGVRDALIAGVRSQIAPLADRDLTGTGLSFLEEVGVDADVLNEQLPLAVIRAVEQVATFSPALAPLAAQLNADDLRAEVRALREQRQPQSTQSGHANATTDDFDIFRLVDALLAVEAFADEGGRRELFRLLPDQIAAAIPRNQVPRVQALSTLRTCLAYQNGLRKLLEIIQLLEPDSLATNRFEQTAKSILVKI